MKYKSHGSNYYDEKFNLLVNKNLTYLPYIGTNFLKSTPKILVVGESHYADNENTVELHKDKNLSRAVINSKAKENSNSTFRNFNKAILGNDKSNTSELWDNLAFFNLIQRPMTTVKHRPIKKDFIEGWQSFFDVIEIIKPDDIIFIGVKASNYLRHSVKSSNYKIKSFKKDSKVGRTYPRNVIINNLDRDLNITFIQHSSKFFSHEKWHKYLTDRGVI
mgnify:CR=1 FL=1